MTVRGVLEDMFIVACTAGNIALCGIGLVTVVSWLIGAPSC